MSVLPDIDSLEELLDPYERLVPEDSNMFMKSNTWEAFLEISIQHQIIITRK